MTIYSSLPPTHLMPREPINAMRAREGLRPLCFNRPEYPDWFEIQRGIEPVVFATPDGKTGTVFAPAFDLVQNPMSRDCKAWSVHPQEDPATESIPGRESWRCWGCRHLPQDQRAIERAKKSEAA